MINKASLSHSPRKSLQGCACGMHTGPCSRRPNAAPLLLRKQPAERRMTHAPTQIRSGASTIGTEWTH
ncbi:hypothetical protein SKAU_G00168810 [Synaphobranchus kaupii]|uniref:Uncharacterized protein n=1 Tax=Synaphobranchus kaupii TaxID=118154 RepID=A0A9Q1FK49_SYNKA|nr:hypothetical protein SKAU_G00168810 [Synaphobranchus kaupii]